MSLPVYWQTKIWNYPIERRKPMGMAIENSKMWMKREIRLISSVIVERTIKTVNLWGIIASKPAKISSSVSRIPIDMPVKIEWSKSPIIIFVIFPIIGFFWRFPSCVSILEARLGLTNCSSESVVICGLVRLKINSQSWWIQLSKIATRNVDVNMPSSAENQIVLQLARILRCELWSTLVAGMIQNEWFMTRRTLAGWYPQMGFDNGGWVTTGDKILVAPNESLQKRA